MKPDLMPTVNLDSDAIRRIREEKKLTQLYVAKVVGVTTDTVSRWENNRYPSIKRENALRLAEALEVPIEDILEKTVLEEPGPGEAGHPEKQRRRVGIVLAGSVVVFVILAALLTLYAISHKDEIPLGRFSSERQLPNFAAPGDVIPVRIKIATDNPVKGFIVRERFPAGWQLVEASPPPSSLDNEEGVSRWIIKPGEEQKRVVYRLKVGRKSEDEAQAGFGGEIIINPKGRSLSIPIKGDETVEVAPILWADLNGDGVVDDGEMLEASDTIDEMKGVHMDWDSLEEIWDAGGYRWDSKKKAFVPQKVPPNKSSTLILRMQES